MRGAGGARSRTIRVGAALGRPVARGARRHDGSRPPGGYGRAKARPYKALRSAPSNYCLTAKQNMFYGVATGSMNVATTRRGYLAAALLAALLPGAARALPRPFLVRDINTQPVIFSGNPRQFAVAGGAVWFVADAPEGMGLWKTNGMPAGTVLVRSMLIVGNLVGVGERLFFVGWDPDSGPELWTSDGTAFGTVLVRDIRPGPEGGLDDEYYNNNLATVGDVLFFTADDGVHGNALWRTDGTAAGTVLVKAVAARVFTALPDLLLFVSSDAAHGTELWRSDGTADGTVLLRDINPGDAGSDPFGFLVVGGTAFFAARDALHGVELWRSDGSEAGTAMVADVTPGPGDSFPQALGTLGNDLFFFAGDPTVGASKLWKTDGSSAGTMRVTTSGHLSSPGFVPFDGTALFAQEVDDMGGFELWRTDGSTAGTELVKDIYPGYMGSFPAALTALGDMALFRADDGVHGTELWRSDGTPSGTVLVRDINHGTGASLPQFSNDPLVELNGRLLFAADDGEHGVELWSSDGSEAGT